MSLTAKQANTVREFFKIIATRSEDIGAEALSRMVAVYPQTKSYFSHWESTEPGSPAVKKHGSVIVGGIFDAVSKLDDLRGGLLGLSELHAFMLRVDPVNFKLLSHCFLVCISAYYPEEFTPKVHVAVDKFLVQVSLALSDKYR